MTMQVFLILWSLRFMPPTTPPPSMPDANCFASTNQCIAVKFRMDEQVAKPLLFLAIP
ncbi:uncharacterized protein G2W53_001910 [Senna tora]|uniref:Uncharacterized protein n=1 Tax=Senna tora TaxID=362788 RepID=A0A834XGC4_9FABA|nr:uncharacterized protein G2W53_001910 [Senna tora]